MVPPLAVISEKREQPNDPLMCMLTEPVSDRVSLLDDSSGSAKRRFTKTKRVKFAVDARGNVVEEIHTVPKVPSSPGMHWCSARISEFQNNSRNLAAIYRHEREDLFETIETLYESPSDTIDKDIALVGGNLVDLLFHLGAFGRFNVGHLINAVHLDAGTVNLNLVRVHTCIGQ